MALREIDDQVLIGEQIMAADVADLADRGVTLIINNRPDGEEPGQPPAADIEAATRAAGLDYRFIPVADEFADDKVAAMADAIAGSEGRVLAFCRSGTRSAYLWALARTRHGADANDLIWKAARAGYNIRPLMPWLKEFSPPG